MAPLEQSNASNQQANRPAPFAPDIRTLLDRNRGPPIQECVLISIPAVIILTLFIRAAVRRVAEAATTFAPQVSVQTRALAPGPGQRSNITDLFVPAGIAGGRLAYNAMPTAVPLPPVASATLETGCSVTFAVFPCKVG